jgi:nicotinate-nucleotide adenylyltransferase
MIVVEAKNKAIGILGGSFDPVHLGHLWIAEAALEQLPVEHVRWFPAATSPLKQHGPIATNDQRLTMLRLALSGYAEHVVDTHELDRDGISYTVDTLEYLRQAFPDRRLYLIMGADSLASLSAWKSPEQLLQLCTLAVIARGGQPPPNYEVMMGLASPEKIAECQAAEIVMPQIEISSSDMRSRVAQSRSIRFRVPHPVDAFIRQTALYRDS